jgi:uncharacterized membrane protein
MGIELVILAVWGLQLFLFLGTALSAIARRQWTQAVSWTIGGLIGFTPIFIIKGSALSSILTALLVGSGAVILLCLARSRNFADLGIVSALGILLFIGSKSYYGGPDFLRLLGLLYEITVLFTPLLCAIAGSALATALNRRIVRRENSN